MLVCEERWVRCWWLLLLFSCEMYGRNEVVSAFSTDPGSSQGYLVQRSAGCGELGSAISGDPHDVWSLSSSATRLCFVLRFWNHTFTCTNMVSTLVYTIRDKICVVLFNYFTCLIMFEFNYSYMRWLSILLVKNA